MRFISAPLSFPAEIFEAMFVPRISYHLHDTREDRGSAARKNTDTGAACRRLAIAKSVIPKSMRTVFRAGWAWRA
jgi:hypothetical protein